MKKILIIANMLFISATVFGTQNNKLIRHEQSSNNLRAVHRNIDHQNENGDTDLILAMMENNAESAQSLINNGANPEIKNSYGCKAVSFAVARDSQYFTELFLKNTSDVNFKDSKGKSLWILP